MPYLTQTKIWANPETLTVPETNWLDKLREDGFQLISATCIYSTQTHISIRYYFWYE